MKKVIDSCAPRRDARNLELFSEFLATVVLPSLPSDSQRKKFRMACGSLARFLGREPRLDDLTTESLRGTLTRMIEIGRASWTVKEARECLNKIARLAFENRLINEQPNIESCDLPPCTVHPISKGVVVWTRSNVEQLLGAAQTAIGDIDDVAANVWWTALLLVLLDTGAKIRELLAATQNSFDVATGQITIGLNRYTLHPLAHAAVKTLCPHPHTMLFHWPKEGGKPGGILLRDFAYLCLRAGISIDELKLFECLKYTSRKLEGILDSVDINAPFTDHAPLADPDDDSIDDEFTNQYLSDRQSENSVLVFPEDPTLSRRAGIKDLSELRQSLTIRQAYDTFVRPERDPVSSATATQYQSALNLWERYSGNPPVCQITRATIMGFRQRLIDTPIIYTKLKQKSVPKITKHRSPATINRIMRELHVVVSPMWPADRVNPSGLGLMEFFKWPKVLVCVRQPPRVYEHEELDRLYLNADAVRPVDGRRSGMHETRLWRLALALSLNCGARAFDLFNLRWRDVQLEPSGKYRHGWVEFVATKTKKRHRVPLNNVAAIHLRDCLVRPVISSQSVFPGFQKTKGFYSAWRRICRAANLSGDFNSMRKTCVSRHNDIVFKSGYWISGHLEPGVFGNYDNPSERIFEAVYKLETPSEFVKGAQKLIAAREAWNTLKASK